MQENHVPYLITQLKHNDNAPYSRRIARDTLVSMGSPIIPALIEGLKNENFWILSGILDVLGEIGGIEEVPAITPFIESSEVMVVRRAVMALAKIGDPRPIPRIIDLMEDANWHIKAIAADGLYYYFLHESLRDLLYSEMLKAFFEKGNREDYLIAKFEEIGWHIPMLEADPLVMIRSIIERVEKALVVYGDLVYLRYFFQKSLVLLELRLNSVDFNAENDYFSNEHRIRLLKLHKQLLEKGQIPISEQFHLLI